MKQGTDFEFQAVIIAIPRNFPQDIDKDRSNSEKLRQIGALLGRFKWFNRLASKKWTAVNKNEP